MARRRKTMTILGMPWWLVAYGGAVVVFFWYKAKVQREAAQATIAAEMTRTSNAQLLNPEGAGD